jgi:hypothetical protein
MRLATFVIAITVMSLSGFVAAQQGDVTHQRPATEDAWVDFGALPTAPLGPAPCLQSGAIGGPTDPCQFATHRLSPEEVTIFKGNEVTFQVHGGGHAIALYEVSKDTTRTESVRPCAPDRIQSGFRFPSRPRPHTAAISRWIRPKPTRTCGTLSPMGTAMW